MKTTIEQKVKARIEYMKAINEMLKERIIHLDKVLADQPHID